MLVFLVMYLFLQNMRATLIPTIAVPVVLLGTFAILAAFGYSINTRSTFSTTTIASSTSSPMASTIPNIVSVLME
ncbi:efflux RND transporter permease subunit [Escherichia coli]|uniref:efflux RND transporter permease subunit n=1 Tax=Escherichia coli TaxID=562 RepID=UPI004067A2F0